MVYYDLTSSMLNNSVQVYSGWNGKKRLKLSQILFELSSVLSGCHSSAPCGPCVPPSPVPASLAVAAVFLSATLC